MFVVVQRHHAARTATGDSTSSSSSSSTSCPPSLAGRRRRRRRNPPLHVCPRAAPSSSGERAPQALSADEQQKRTFIAQKMLKRNNDCSWAWDDHYLEKDNLESMLVNAIKKDYNDVFQGRQSLGREVELENDKRH